jgi:hypothetical protein
VDSLKALDLKRPIREADMAHLGRQVAVLGLNGLGAGIAFL